MFKKFVLTRCQKKIDAYKPKVNITLNFELPTPSLREITSYAKTVSLINGYEEEIKAKPDGFFKEKTLALRESLREKISVLSSSEEEKQVIEEFLDEQLPFYFALIREASLRTLKMRHFDVQLVGGLVLHKNKIAEMVTGEGKTLVATLAASLNALVGRGVHVVTVNDYLARRDKEWMAPLYEFLGFSIGVIQQDMGKEERKHAYQSDITYGTNNEFGFDYLRDNMVTSKEEMVQRGHHFAIVDEVDSILVDEARTPLIISGPAEQEVEKYYRADRAVRQLKVKKVISSYDNKDGTVTIKNVDGSEVVMTPEEIDQSYDAIIEEKSHNSYLTQHGERRCEKLLGIGSVSDDAPDKSSHTWNHYLTQSLRAHSLFRIDKEYIVKEDRVIIVDEFTGRLMPGRRWSDGLHQAVEAKENLRIQEESQTLATVTLQNYFRMYFKLSGMTGTAYTEANEFRHIYKLDVVAIATNKPLIRKSYADRIYKSKKGKFNAVVDEIHECFTSKRPVLVGTTSIEDSEMISFLLQKKGITHNVLNAKYHENEAYIVAQAGRLGQITIATNMAGRGTDIILGGNIDYFIKDFLRRNNVSLEQENYWQEYRNLYEKYRQKFEDEHNQVVEKGGLHVIGTQRHESRRIDNQLRGRAGRQGDPGSSRFYVALDDELMRLFGSERIYFLMERFGFPEDQPIEHVIISSSMEVAQKRVEGHNFEVRKHLLEYDNVMNKQREIIYALRQEILEKEDIHELVKEMISEVVLRVVPGFFQEEPDLLALTHWLKQNFNIEKEAAAFTDLAAEEIAKNINSEVEQIYNDKCVAEGRDFAIMEKFVVLWVLDSRWKEHLLIMDSLKEGIHLRGYAHVDPLVEYQKEAYFTFEDMLYTIKEGSVEALWKTKVRLSQPEAVFQESPKEYLHSQYSPLQKNEENVKPSPIKKLVVTKKVGRNESCPCGSGKKYKKCCGQ